MTDVVLDASAVLALILEEPGAAGVAAQLDGGRLSTVNLAEVAQRLADRWTDAQVGAVLAAFPFEVVDFDRATAVRAGLMRRVTRAHGLSLGDRACLALAERLAAPVLTADRAWAELDLGVEVVLIR
ncbi:type II toxin-antitoxin system VapC family toxin [Phenylobacterium sp.]|jgi:PIN domain nuclease of toxin-antitoxin system|uniref:type II toxin-antitoxin system VapC family toxin n=1 Tax=Phenylobacterium sp. TaxID=1871053 RepID=UPI002F3FD179